MKSFSKLCLLLLIFISYQGQSAFSSTENYAKRIKEQADRMGQLLVKKDFKGFVKYGYPKMIALMGGEAKLATAMDEGAKKMKDKGMEILSISFGEPSEITTVGKDFQCTVPQTMEMKTPKGKMVAHSTLIAISQDNGKNWRFIDTAGKDIKTLKGTFPELSEKLVIPEQQKPTMSDR